MNAHKGSDALSFGRTETTTEPPVVHDQQSPDLSSLFYPELAEWQPILLRLGIQPDRTRRIALQAMLDGVSFLATLLAAGIVEEMRLFQAIADDLGATFAATIDADRLAIRDDQCVALLRRPAGTLQVRYCAPDGTTRFIVSTSSASIASLRARLARSPDLGRRLLITTPAALRAALMERARPRLLSNALNGLADMHPELSARTVLTARQGMFFGALAVAAPLGLVTANAPLTEAMGWTVSLLFLTCVMLRIAAAISAKPLRLAPIAAVDPAALPVYSVLVALNKERDMVPELLVALGKLNWPRSKLDIKLVCEADDRATIDAIRTQQTRPWVEIVEVPFAAPQTKPKALAYALQLARGDYVVLYDAEDKPHRDQLIEAWQCFANSGPEIACVQAPLIVSNGRRNFWTRMFAVEYAALFRGLLPWLARRRLIVPLGGTSNHFRREALEIVGGWDPYNVTEDADLGLRLARLGYRTRTITRPTYEAAPDDFRTWLPQRTRWFKGWLLTWLVHMRAPAYLAVSLGPASFVVSQILFVGMVLSATVHPLLLYTLFMAASGAVLHGPVSYSESWLVRLDLANVALCYVSFWVLGWRTLTAEERRGFGWVLPLTPFYWIAMFLAALLAIYKLIREPHHWDKTPHRSARALKARRAAGTAAAVAPPVTVLSPSSPSSGTPAPRR